MKTNRNFVNILPLLIYMLTFVLLLCLPILILADGTGTISKEKALTAKELRLVETILPYEHRGTLLPWKTYQTDDTIERPKYWNGYGVDPSGVNYWNYWNKETECFPGYSSVWEGTDHCKQEEEAEVLQMVTIPEPSGMMLLGTGICFIWLMIRRKQ